MKCLRWYKPLAMALLCIIFIVVGQLIHILKLFSARVASKLANLLISICSKAFLKILNLKIVSNIPPTGQFFIVSNHMGYLDVLALSSKVRSSFVTSTDLSQNPIQRLLFSSGQCILVDRKNSLNSVCDIKKIVHKLSLGSSVEWPHEAI